MLAAAAQHAPTSGPILRWVSPPQQERTRAALNRLLDAAEAVVSAKGFDGASIQEIAKRAQVSIGGFYRRFPDKDALMRALHQRFCEEAMATADEALAPAVWEGASTATILEQFVTFLVHIFREREGFFRAFLLRGPADPEVSAATANLFEYISARLVALLAHRRNALRHPEPEAAVGFALRVVIGTLNHAVQVRGDAVRLSDERVPTELSRVLIRYLDPADE